MSELEKNFMQLICTESTRVYLQLFNHESDRRHILRSLNAKCDIICRIVSAAFKLLFNASYHQNTCVFWWKWEYRLKSIKHMANSSFCLKKWTFHFKEKKTPSRIHSKVMMNYSNMFFSPMISIWLERERQIYMCLWK